MIATDNDAQAQPVGWQAAPCGGLISAARHGGSAARGRAKASS